MKRIIVLLAVVAIVVAIAVLGGGPAIAVDPGQGEPNPACKGIVKAAEKSGREELKAKTGELDCGPGVPPKV